MSKLGELAARLEGHQCPCPVIVDTTIAACVLSANCGCEEGDTMEAAVALREVEQLLREVLDVSDDFVRSTGLKHGDAITDAVEKIRTLIE